MNFTYSEINHCLLCHQAPCNIGCPKNINISKTIRSLYFENYLGAINEIKNNPCINCDAICEKNCILNNSGKPIQIKQSFINVNIWAKTLPTYKIDKVDISTNICGIKLENPFMLSSSVVGSTYEMCARAFEMGWAGVSFKTINNFEQHETSPRFSSIFNHSNAFCGFKNIEQLSDHSVEENMNIFRKLKENYPTKVIIASIMGRNEKEWEYLAKECDNAGADIIECNFSCPNMENDKLGSTIGQSSKLVEKFTRATKRGTNKPVLAKLTPNITDMIPIAISAKKGGADGISTINTIFSITGVDIDTLVAEPNVEGQTIVGGYSGPAVKPIALRYISDLARCKELKDMHISGMGGIETWRDALEFLLLGATSLQVTTAVMQYGYRIITDMIEGLTNYLKCKGIYSIKSLIGASIKTIVDHQEIHRDTILLPVIEYDKCNNCGRCYISCRDGGHQAIEFNKNTHKVKIIGKKCVGCHLCRLVCPNMAINVASKRINKNN